MAARLESFLLNTFSFTHKENLLHDLTMKSLRPRSKDPFEDLDQLENWTGLQLTEAVSLKCEDRECKVAVDGEPLLPC